MTSTYETAETLQGMLEYVGLDTELVSEAQTGSIYLRFLDSRMGQIRIGDHPERERYGYRWQIRTDIAAPSTDDRKGHKRFFYPAAMLTEAVEHMLRYRAGIYRHN